MSIAGRLNRAWRKMKRGGRPRPGRLALLVLAGVLATAGVAMAAVVGLQNPGFEDPLGPSNWNASTFRDGAYHAANCADPGNRDAVYDEVCQISGNDSFTVREGVYETPRNVTVSPIEGAHMVRLGGPYNDSSQAQPRNHAHLVEQSYQVPNTSNPQLDLSYNIYTFDYTGFDNLGVRVQLTDSNGTVIAEQDQGSFGPGGDISLKTTGWRPLHYDLDGYQGQDVHLKIAAAGTKDNLYGFWAYLDGPGATAGTVDGAGTQSHPPTDPATQQPAHVQSYSDPSSGQTFFSVSPQVVGDFPAGGGLSHCMPLSVTVPINAGSGSISNATLTLTAGGTKHVYPLSAGAGGYSGTIDCVRTGTLYVDYDLTENSTSQHFTVPIGGLALIDPSGTVVDKATGQMLSGASVRLFRKNGSGGYDNVLSGDPGITPNVNPETTGSDGKWGWDVSAGTYRVVATKAGYDPLTSQDLVVTPGNPITGVTLALTATQSGGSNGGGGGGNNGGATNAGNGGGTTSVGNNGGGTTGNGGNTGGGSNSNSPGQTGPCTGKKGALHTVCVNQHRDLAKCSKIKNKKKRATCVKVANQKAKALAKCTKIKNTKKRAACVKKANRIGRKKR
jgi:Carboxypeptidase regulatory-like domain